LKARVRWRQSPPCAPRPQEAARTDSEGVSKESGLVRTMPDHLSAPPPPGLDALGRFVSRRELGALAPVLAEGEQVLYAVDGHHDGKPGILAATDRRVVHVRARLLGRQVTAWDYDDVRHAQSQAGVDDATVTLHLPERAFVLTGVRKAGAEGLLAALRPLVADRTFRPARVVQDARHADPVEEGESPTARLRRLDRMRARGAITEAEHKVNRRRILEDAGLPTDLSLRGRP